MQSPTAQNSTDDASAIETPSGKGAGDENFPVGSWLLSARLRPHIAAFYAFARAIDDIADNPALPAAEKVARLERFAAALRDPAATDPALATAHRLCHSLVETGVSPRHGLDLIAAFKRDAVTPRTRDWRDLLDYCNLSANPVGRYLLDLHNENPDRYAAADGLCSVLQVLNHLQDCQDDYRQLDRVYLPADWLAEAGLGVEVLDQSSSPPPLRQVFDRCLDGCDDLLAAAADLPKHLSSRRLAAESAVILALARRLAARLRRDDPLARRVRLTRFDFAGRGLMALAALPFLRGG